MHTDGIEFLRLLLDLELVKLPEDITLAGFTPLMLNPQDPCYVEKTEDMVGPLCYIRSMLLLLTINLKLKYCFFFCSDL